MLRVMNILYGISGGIAAYKAPEVVRLLVKRGHAVRCVLTANGAHLVSREALAVVSQHPVRTSMWEDNGEIGHIELARWCDACLIAPATADILAKLALGLADDLLSTLFLALEPGKRVVLAPAMNTVMWNKPVVQRNVATLVGGGAQVVGPVEGQLACGEKGIGAMADMQAIVEAVDG
jgi:phosphopantothenoylcysteine decarboxylase/phosphopantothenate--cysteine ligase